MKRLLLLVLCLASQSVGAADQQPLFVESPCREFYEYHFLYGAASRGDVGGARLLLEHGANVDGLGYEKASECGFGYEFSSPLRGAVSIKSIAMVRLLLSFGADPNMLEGVGVTPTDIARRDGSKEILDLLVEHGGR